MRELKEETGIKLDADDIKNCVQIDLLQNDNLNPHKGNDHVHVHCTAVESAPVVALIITPVTNLLLCK